MGPPAGPRWGLRGFRGLCGAFAGLVWELDVWVMMGLYGFWGLDWGRCGPLSACLKPPRGLCGASEGLVGGCLGRSGWHSSALSAGKEVVQIGGCRRNPRRFRGLVDQQRSHVLMYAITRTTTTTTATTTATSPTTTTTIATATPTKSTIPGAVANANCIAVSRNSTRSGTSIPY